MTQEEKDLLLKDICGRLPYSVKVYCSKYIGILTLVSIDMDEDSVYIINRDDPMFSTYMETETIKPYLFPISSMTEEQMIEYKSLCNKVTSECGDIYGTRFVKDYYYDTVESIDYLYKNHIDIRGIIPKGLAIDATGKNIY